MRRILAFLVTTVDGYYEGPNQEFDWPVVDEEFNEFGLEQLDEVDTLLFGRVTYEGMALFRTATGRIGLELVETRPFRSGSVMLFYRPAGSH
jgi:dihydrofolate reductase